MQNLYRMPFHVQNLHQYNNFFGRVQLYLFIYSGIEDNTCCQNGECKAEDVCAEYIAESPYLGKDCKCYCPGYPVRLCSEPKPTGNTTSKLKSYVSFRGTNNRRHSLLISAHYQTGQPKHFLCTPERNFPVQFLFNLLAIVIM